MCGCVCGGATTGRHWPGIDHNEQNDLKWGHCLPMWETLDLASASELTIESRVSRAARRR